MGYVVDKMARKLFLSFPLPSTLHSPVQIPTTALCELPSERQQRPSIPGKYFASKNNLLSDVCCQHFVRSNMTTGYWLPNEDFGHWMSDCGAALLQVPGSHQPLQEVERVYLHGKSVETLAACISPRYIPCPTEARMNRHYQKVSELRKY